jgi:23S rRNA (guanosine2251-2'-O)-methyltransferase
MPLTDYQFPNPSPSILIVGNEVTGVDPELLDLCDQILHIPMLGKKRSFNVEVAFGIAAFQLTRE